MKIIRRRQETPDQQHERLQREQGERLDAAAVANAGAIGRRRRKAAMQAQRAARKARRAARHPAGPAPGSLRTPRLVALIAIAVVIGAASTSSFAESYRALFDWAHEHGLSGTWAAVFPLMIDSFVVVGELALFVALTDSWSLRQRAGAWATTLAGLAVSVAGNVGHVHGHLLSNRATAAVPPLAAFAALWVGLGVLKRVVGQHHGKGAPETVLGMIPPDVLAAAKASMTATLAAGNPLSANQLQARFGLTRAQAAELRKDVLAQANGHALEETSS